MRLIDADELLNRVEWANTNPLIDHGKVAVGLIHAAPTIDAVKHGRWTRLGDNSYKCSECGEVSCCFAHYCPDCGARMWERA